MSQPSSDTASSNELPHASGDAISNEPAQLDTVAASCRLPAFWPNNPHLWFAQAESEFALKGIRAEATKYHLAIRALSERDISEIADIVSNPPISCQYQTLKEELLRRFQASPTVRLQRLLSTEELGDGKPSQLLRRLYALLGDKAASFDEDCLRELFLRRLPPPVRSLLTVSQAPSLQALALLADKIMEDTYPSIAVLQSGTVHQPVDIQSRLQALEASLENLRVEIQSSRPRRRPYSPGSPPHQRRNNRTPSPPLRRGNRQYPLRQSSPPPDSEYCWYHATFGASARQCRPPCAWPGNWSAGR